MRRSADSGTVPVRSGDFQINTLSVHFSCDPIKVLVEAVGHHDQPDKKKSALSPIG